MSTNKMLIDASHPEETRVVVTRGNRIEEFDFESDHKKQLKGNIYLARVTRVEPSLQAAFVEYGGNRHGFLAFSEIHPDYYQIPVADRQALIAEEEMAASQSNDLDDDEDEKASRSKNKGRGRKSKNGQKGNGQSVAELTQTDSISEKVSDDSDHDDDDVEEIESVGAEDALEELPVTKRSTRKNYNIQEVIKRRQILLVQVLKEERGNKGAALTTYLSLAGRYSVLMPNTARGGGISRKITNITDRKRLKDIVRSLEVPKGMGVILRTAGANRTKVEIKRDYEYLMRMWENVRELTLQSTAPSLVYEEGSLIKRSIRDLYNKDISEILVAGEEGYREAKNFMRMLMPSHAKVVQPYRDFLPIFSRNGIETQLDRMLQPQVTLKSGGYLIINQTEALVAIDVNSGRSTKEHSIEETAVQTNLEAAEEVARQLRLRDLAGLVVIDFIDMEEKRNIRAVEKKLKDCLKDDRARIQVGRISHFGLMEMSRQRIRASVLESTMQICPHCGGAGHIRSDSSLGLHIIRTIEEYLLRNPHNNIIVRTPVTTALYVLNHKRHILSELETRFGLTISIEADDSVGIQQLAIYKSDPAIGVEGGVVPILIEDDPEPVEAAENAQNVVHEDNDGQQNKRNKRRRRGGRDHNGDDAQKSEAEASVNGAKISAPQEENGEDDRRRKRRRGRRGGRRHRDHDFDRRLPFAEPVGAFAEQALAEVKAAKRRKNHNNNANTIPDAEPVGFIALPVSSSDKSSENGNANKNRNNRSRNGRRNDRNQPQTQDNSVVSAPVVSENEAVEDKPKRKQRGRPKSNRNDVAKTGQDQAIDVTASNSDAQPESAAADTMASQAGSATIAEKPKRGRRRKTPVAQTEAPADVQAETVSAEAQAADAQTTEAPKRKRRTKAEPTAAKKSKPASADKVQDKDQNVDTKPMSAQAVEISVPNIETSSTNEQPAKDETKPKPTVQGTEPVVTSSGNQSDEQATPSKSKKMGWWQRKGFF